MSLMRTTDQTPCGALFDVLKRIGGINHKELATLILSERPLPDGRSPVSRANDRTWVSRFIVHAPADTTQERYFRAVSYTHLDVYKRQITERLGCTRASSAVISPASTSSST